VTNATAGNMHAANGSINLTRENSTSTFWTATFNTTNFPDGHYNVTVWAYDHTIGNRTAIHPAGLRGNVNNSALITNLTIDNTVPTVSLSCTPNPVAEDSKITCTCSTADDTEFAATGIKSTSFTANPNTANSGTFSTSCSTSDYALNEASTTLSYTVKEDGVGGSSGTSSSSGGTSTGAAAVIWKTYPVDNSEFTSSGGTSRKVGKNERLKVKVEDEDHTVGVTAIGTDSVTFEISSVPQSATLKIGETKKFEVSEDGYYDIQVTLNGISGGKADVTLLAIHEMVPADELAEIERQREEVAGGGVPTDASSGDKKSGNGWIVGLVLGIVAVIVVVVIVVAKRKK
jgi:hypothetical protein